MNSRFLSLFLALVLTATGHAQTSTSTSTVNSSSSSQSVTVTSDGKNTIKRSVTVVDGVEKVIIETTDENGKTTRKEVGVAEPEQATGPWIGIRVKEVSKILRGQLDLAEEGRCLP